MTAHVALPVLALLFNSDAPARIMNPHGIDFAIIVIYFVMVLGIGFYLKKYTQSGEDFFLAGREMTAWVAGLSFVSANLGTLELMGWAGNAYQYGILAAHWYWVGAIPAMVFLGIVMMPFYYISKTHSVPGYLQLRYGESASALSAVCFAFMTILMSGVNMFAMALVMKVMLGWDLNFSIWVSSLTVGVYVAMGGLFSAIFNEVVQFFLIWFGALLIPILGLIETGGWSGMVARIHQNFPGQDFTHLWSGMGHFQDNPMGVQWVGIVFGLGCMLSMGYWTTDFLVVQRVTRRQEIRAPPNWLRSSDPSSRWPCRSLSSFPGCWDWPYCQTKPEISSTSSRRVLMTPGQHSYDEVLPLMLARYCGPGLLGLGITALIAGFMSGMAGNVSAFATVWTYDIYRPFIKKDATDAQYVSMGRWCTIIGLIISIGAAYIVTHFGSLMDYVQALFSFFIAPLFGTVLIGMMWKRATGPGGFWGLLAGTGSSIVMFTMVELDPSKVALIALSPYAKPLAVDMWRALWSGIICVVVTVVVSLATKPKTDLQLEGLVYGCHQDSQRGSSSSSETARFSGRASRWRLSWCCSGYSGRRS